MKSYDISRELFASEVYPGDPIPQKRFVKEIKKGDPYNLSEIRFGSHAGTHIDAPYHFCPQGNTVEKIELEDCMGSCFVMGADRVDAALVRKEMPGDVKRVLFRKGTQLCRDGDRALLERGIRLVGVEENSVDQDGENVIHKMLLENNVVILENIDLSEVKNGWYFIAALPLKLEGVDGAPCRAVLMDTEW